MLFLRSVIYSLLHLTHIFSFFIKLNKNTCTNEMESVFALQGWKVKPCMACSQGLLPDCQVTWYTEGEWDWPRCCFLHTMRMEKWVKWEPPARKGLVGSWLHLRGPEIGKTPAQVTQFQKLATETRIVLFHKLRKNFL